MQLLLRFMKPTNHEHINFIILVYIVFPLFYSLNQELLELLVALSGGEVGLCDGELHKGLVEQDTGQEEKLLFAHCAGFVVLVHDQGNPLG